MPTYNIDPALLAINTPFSGLKKINILLIGPKGSGKTTASITGPKPVYYYGLDRGGSVGIKKLIPEGWLVVDDRFENDDPMKPRAIRDFEQDFNTKFTQKTFHQFGSVIFDSATGIGESSMNRVLANANRPGEAPVSGGKHSGFENSDYAKQKRDIRNLLYKALSLPCTVIFTAHIAAPNMADDEKAEMGRSVYGIEALPLVTGDLRIRLPQMFNEIYFTEVLPTPNGLKGEFITAPEGIFKARSSIAYGGKLATREPANIMNVMKKSGLTIPDVIPQGFYETIPQDVAGIMKHNTLIIK